MEVNWLNAMRVIAEVFSIFLNIYLTINKNKEKNEKISAIKEQQKEEKLKLGKKDREIKSLKKEIEDLKKEKLEKLEAENNRKDEKINQLEEKISVLEKKEKYSRG